MKTTKLLKSTLGVAAVAIAASVGIFAYEKHQQQELAMANPLLAENLAALTEDNNTYPRYKNHTDKSTNVEWETKVDTTGLHIKFKRTCVTYYTYCKETGKEDDICYGQLNKLETTCGDWAKD